MYSYPLGLGTGMLDIEKKKTVFSTHCTAKNLNPGKTYEQANVSVALTAVFNLHILFNSLSYRQKTHL